MQHRHRLAEARHEAAHDLRGQRDLGHQHDRAPPPLQCTRRCAQVHLRLARPRDPVQQQRRAAGEPAHPPPPARRPVNASRSSIASSARRWSSVSGGGSACSAPIGSCCGRGTTARSPLAHAEAVRSFAGRARRAARAAVHARLSSSTPPRSTPPAPPGPPAGGEDFIQRAQRLKQLLLGHLAAFGEAHHHPQHLAPAERHHQHRTHLHDATLELRRQPVVERAAQRAGCRQRLDLGDRTRHGWVGSDHPRWSAGLCPRAHGPKRSRQPPDRPPRAAARALSVRSHVKSWSSRPKWPYAAVFW